MKRNRVFLMVVSLLATTIGLQASTSFVAEAAPPTFRSAASSNANVVAGTVDVPGDVQEGDQLVLAVTVNTDATITTPAGWTLLGTEQDGRNGAAPDMSSAVFTTTADAGTAGSTVTATLSSRSKTAMTLVAYAGALPPTTALASTQTGSGTALATPGATVASNDSTVVSYWANKTSSNTGWTAPAGTATRVESIGSGGGRVTALLGDNTVDAGTWTGAEADAATGGTKAIGWTIIVPPAPTTPPANVAPTADFTYTCDELACDFTDASTDTDGVITDWAWDFGDAAATSTTQNPSHTFSTTGTYTVALTTTDDDGDTDTTTTDITVATNEPPVALFTIDCTYLSCSFDGTASNEPNGGSIVDWAWDLGHDAETDSGSVITHDFPTTGSYTVALTVTDDDGQTHTSDALVAVTEPPNVAPTADFTYTCTLLVCDFDGGPSFEENGTIADWAWDFGDDAAPTDTATGETATHTFSAVGDYTVELVVTDDDGQTDTTSATVSVIENILPTASFSVDCVDLDCDFDATASADSDGTIERYDWDFGDTNSADDAGSITAHSFGAAGTYTVSLTVTDDYGSTATTTLEITVTANELPIAAFTVDCNDLQCQFDAIGSNEPNGEAIARFDWDFGNGDTVPDGGIEVEKNYLVAGTYTVTLTVTDDDGQTASVSIDATATFPAAPTYELPPDIPRRNVPIISTGEITDLEYIGNRVYIVGSFSSIQNNVGNNNNTINQRWVAAYDMDTGLVDTDFRPTFDSGVTEIARSPDGTKLFVVGRFNSVNGITRRKIASIDPDTGATVTSFTANANSAATAVAVSNDTVYVGGQFSTVRGVPRLGLAALDIDTGAVRSDFVNDLTGGIGVNGALQVQALDLSQDLTTLLVVHTGRQVNGQNRYGVAIIDATTNQLTEWRARLWEDNLRNVGGINRIYTGAISPDGSYFVVGSGSGGDRPPISDTAVAYRLFDDDGNMLGDLQEPLWISRMFDSIYSIDIADDAVFLGGHMNYVESQTAPDPWPGLDNVGYGQGQGLAGYGLGDDIVIRNHITAIDPVYGKAIEWNPGSNSFEGNKAMLVTPRGLFTGGDGMIQGGYRVGRVAFYDIESVTPDGQNTTKILYPVEGRVEKADEEFVIGGTATATSGVQRVQVEVVSNGRYLQDDLVTWGNWNAVNAIVEDPGSTSTTWALPLTISGNREIKFLARTFGNNGSSANTKDRLWIETFGLSDETPNTRITGPSGVIPTLDFTATGTADDDLGVAAIRISLRDAQNRYLQDDGTVDDLYNTVTIEPDVVGAIDATWSYEVTVPYESEWTMQAIAVDTSGQADLRSSTRSWIVNETAIRPEVAITSPVVVSPPFDVVYQVAPGSPLTLTGIASDDEGLRDVEIRIRNRTTDENLDSAGQWGIGLIRRWHRISPANISGTSYNWTYTTPFTLDQGRYEFEIRATDDVGLSTSYTLEAELDVDVVIEGDSPPDARLDLTGNIYDVDVLHLDLTGTATDDIGVDEVLIELYDYDTRQFLQADGTTGGDRARMPTTVVPNPDSTSVTWSVSLDLPREGDWYVQAYAIDTSGQLDLSQSGAAARYFVYPGDTPPVITLLSPPDGTTFDDARLVISGRVEDDRQIASAQVAVRNSDGLYLNSSGDFTSSSTSWRPAFLNSPGSPGSNFSYTSPPVPSGDYTVFVRGIDQRGFATEVPGEISVSVTSPPNDPPVAAFTVDCVENVCSFDGRSSTDEDTASLEYSWNFGNGGGSGAVPTRTYTSEGVYTVTLTVEDFYGLEAEVSQDITIVTPAGNAAPVPVLNAPSCSLLTCNFSSLGTDDPDDGDSFSVLWDFGDGDTSSSTFPSHTFDTPGVYTVTLTATDGWGAAASVQIVVDVTTPADNVAPMLVVPTPVCTGLSCEFSTTGTTDSNTGDTFTIAWDFGDATTGTGAAPVHAYAAAGVYSVTVTATDVWGAASSTVIDVTVTEA